MSTRGTPGASSATDRIGWSAGSNFWTTGSEASSGSASTIASTRCLTSMAAWSTSTDSENWAMTKLNPSPLKLLMSVTPGTVARASSIGSVTCSAASSEPAPG